MSRKFDRRSVEPVLDAVIIAWSRTWMTDSCSPDTARSRPVLPSAFFAVTVQPASTNASTQPAKPPSQHIWNAVQASSPSSTALMLTSPRMYERRTASLFSLPAERNCSSRKRVTAVWPFALARAHPVFPSLSLAVTSVPAATSASTQSQWPPAQLA